MNIFFDVDYTLLALDGSLRPGTHKVFQALKDEGQTIYIWSGVGLRHYEVQVHGLAPYVSGIYEKPLGEFEKIFPRLGIPVTPEFIIDDYPEIVEYFGGFHIKPYIFADPSDTALDIVHSTITTYLQTGYSSESGFSLRGGTLNR